MHGGAVKRKSPKKSSPGKKRKPSAYNKFVAEFYKKNSGMKATSMMKAAAAAWKQKKGSK